MMYFMFMDALCTSEEGTGSHETTGIDGCEQSCGYWELNSGPLGKQSVCLAAESSLQPQRKKVYFFEGVAG